MSGKVQFGPFGQNSDLIRNPKSNFFQVTPEVAKKKENRSTLEVCNREIYLGETFQVIDLIKEVRSPIGVQLSRDQIKRLMEQEVIKVIGADQNFTACGIYILTFKYYAQKKGAILIVKDFEQKELAKQKVNLRKKVKNRLDLTRYYRYANIMKHRN